MSIGRCPEQVNTLQCEVTSRCERHARPVNGARPVTCSPASPAGGVAHSPRERSPEARHAADRDRTGAGAADRPVPSGPADGPVGARAAAPAGAAPSGAPGRQARGDESQLLAAGGAPAPARRVAAGGAGAGGGAVAAGRFAAAAAARHRAPAAGGPSGGVRTGRWWRPSGSVERLPRGDGVTGGRRAAHGGAPGAGADRGAPRAGGPHLRGTSCGRTATASGRYLGGAPGRSGVRAGADRRAARGERPGTGPGAVGIAEAGVLVAELLVRPAPACGPARRPVHGGRGRHGRGERRVRRRLFTFGGRAVRAAGRIRRGGAAGPVSPVRQASAGADTDR
ncbi:hypothetical protein SCALM49S_00495 [Streptomyces californicus]